MDEADIDGEDYNELESRLYGQIHHEAVDLKTVEVVNNAVESQAQENEIVKRIVTQRSVVNRLAGASRVPDTRYWANSVKSAKQTTAAINSEVKQNEPKNDNENPTRNIALDTVEASNQRIVNVVVHASENQIQSQSSKNVIGHQLEAQEVQQPKVPKTKNTNLRMNPLAGVKKNSKQNLKKKEQKIIERLVPRSGPFKQQESKLQKALLIHAKKEKSKNVRNKKRKQKTSVETVVVDSSSGSNSGTGSSDDDVVLIPTKPPPTITLSDSDNEGQGAESSAIQMEEDNAMDASDVVMDNKSKSGNFFKPTETRSNVTSENHAEQVSSRCASPCSVLSSDDFIGQTDRSRLLKDNCMADDQDLVLLTADVDSLMQPPQIQSKKSKPNDAAAKKPASEEVICTGQFTAPPSNYITIATTEANSTFEKRNKHQNSFRVEQTEFRAMDVYESESDIQDNVYSKGSNRVRTIINAVDTSSEAEDVQQTPSNQKIKRFSKRRTSINNRGSDAHVHDASTDDELDNDVGKTPVSFILRGHAVEHCSKKIRKRTLSLGSRRASAGDTANAARNMSDNEFIATLNSLVQGREEDKNKRPDGNRDVEENWDDDGQTLSNQDNNIEQYQKESLSSTSVSGVKVEPDRISLQSVQIIEPPGFADAVPDDAIAGLDKIFASIDSMAEPMLQKKAIELEGSSEDEIETIHPPPEVVSSRAISKEIKNTLPIRHIVYNEHNLQTGGIGWNDEMIKFYNFSWHGERFSVVGVHKGMEKDRKLWKIYTEDRYPKMRPYSNLKCFNCCEFGHTRAKCRRPKKPPICYMCGETGHFEPRCPNTICLRCGNKTQMFTKSCNACTFQSRLICPICKVRGHTINLCPDKWRRYHSTTQPNAHPNSQIQFNKRRMCCICGASGHLSDTCRSAVRFMEYPVIVSHVKSHQKSYNDLLFKTPQRGISLNLLYRPGDAVVFHMAEKTAPDGYYGRFLRAVGLGSVLKRKRPSDCLAATEKASKQAKTLSEHYEPNPYGKAAREGVPSSDTANDCNIPETAPNQVQEVSGSVSTVEAGPSGSQDNEYLEDISADGFGHMEYINESRDAVEKTTREVEFAQVTVGTGSEFKAPGEAAASTTTTAMLQSMQHKDTLTVDSDSNYSFSDHYELPPTAGSANKEISTDEAALDMQPSTSAAAKEMLTAQRVRELEPLPDFIPLMDKSDENISDVVDNFDTQTGISRRFVAADDTDEEIEEDASQMQDLPCEAKIYLTHFHSNFLLSPGGHNFLIQKSKECNINARLDWTSVGHVLVIFGLPIDQDIFHKALLEKCRELMDQMNNKQLSSIKVPKRIDALIRFLRENISQLQSELGDVNDLQRRIKHLEQTHTKANMKLAEKFRRQLNMILLGQAGLCDGDKYLEKLLMNLKSLINDYQAENMVPNSLREEIDSHSKMIFTSYRHDNYAELIQIYNKLPRNRQLTIKIDPLLLGQKMLNVSLTAEQRARLEQTPNPTGSFNKQKDSIQSSQTQTEISNESVCSSKVNNRPPNTATVQSSTEIAGTKDKSNTCTHIKRQTVPCPTATSVTKLQEAVQTLKSIPDNIIDNDIMASISGTKCIGNKRAPSKGPSVFWSRESMRYLDECIQLAESNTELLSKLLRIQAKSVEGVLSYNDYRAVIKLHGAMVGH